MSNIERSHKQSFLSLQKDGEYEILSDIVKYLFEFEHLYDRGHKVYPLHMTGIHLILSSVLDENASTTPPEVLQEFYEEINSSEIT